MGLGFGEGFETVDREGFSVIQEESEADELESSALEEDVDDTEEQEEGDQLPSPESHEKPETTTGPGMFKIKLQPSQSALRESNGNKSPIRSPRKVAFSASIPNTPSQHDENADASGVDLVGAEKTSRPTSAAKPPRSEERASRPTSQDRLRHVRYDTLPTSPPSFAKSNNLLQTKKRLSSPHMHPEERSPKLSVQDKLRDAAEAAAVTDGDISTKKTDKSTEMPEENPKKRAPRSPVKTRVGGRPKRRKSTLTPEELANLLGC
jgi:hypothetical protein